MSAITTTKAVGQMRFGDHLCLSYDNVDERRAILATYVHDGLKAGHKIIYLSDTDPAEVVLVWMRETAEAVGVDLSQVDLEAAVERGQLAIRTGAEAYMATGRFDPDEIIGLFATEIDMALVQGYEGVRLTGEETFSLRGWPGTERFAEFERKVNNVFETSEINAMCICQYDRAWFGARRLEHLESLHTGGVRVNDYYDDGNLRIAPMFRPPGLALTGAIDESTYRPVVDALSSIPDKSGLVCLDMSGLAFCDVAGLRALINSYQSVQGMDRQVVLRAVPDHLRKVLRLAGWDTVPGLTVEEEVG